MTMLFICDNELYLYALPRHALLWCSHSNTWVTGCIHAKNTHTWCWVILYKCAHQVPYGFGTLHLWRAGELTLRSFEPPAAGRWSLSWGSCLCTGSSWWQQASPLQSWRCWSQVWICPTVAEKAWRRGLRGCMKQELWCNIKQEGFKEKEEKNGFMVFVWAWARGCKMEKEKVCMYVCLCCVNIGFGRYSGPFIFYHILVS